MFNINNTSILKKLTRNLNTMLQDFYTLIESVKPSTITSESVKPSIIKTESVPREKVSSEASVRTPLRITPNVTT